MLWSTTASRSPPTASRSTWSRSRRRSLGLAGAELFDPSQLGRPMKAWVVVPATHAGKWGGLADWALASAKSGH